MDKKNFEKDIDVPSKRLDRIDKMEIDLSNYEQMELDIEKIIEPYQLNWELDCLSLPSAIQSILERKEQECEKLKEDLIEAKAHGDYLNNLALSETLNLVSEQLDQLKAENEDLKKNLNEGCLHSLTLMTEKRVLLKTLTEIKEIAEVEIECKTYEIEHDCFNETRCKALNEHIDFTEQILQKISEVEDEHN